MAPKGSNECSNPIYLLPIAVKSRWTDPIRLSAVVNTSMTPHSVANFCLRIDLVRIFAPEA
ncbi:hypothetical protein HJFPF1_12571 [Paramyrothecium foliicola]|nr:hypothetical protein HJFPF1_12571 [Paramyrothecium foliicola]